LTRRILSCKANTETVRELEPYIHGFEVILESQSLVLAKSVTNQALDYPNGGFLSIFNELLGNREANEPTYNSRLVARRINVDLPIQKESFKHPEIVPIIPELELSSSFALKEVHCYIDQWPRLVPE
jgi:hypothetical protein